MLIESQHPLNKSIMVSVLGAPNVGKSSMINYLMGMDLSIVTSKPQTTRNRFHCVLTIDHTEVILVDTPGLHNSNKEFNKRMNQQAIDSCDGADINLLLIDLNKKILDQFVHFRKSFKDITLGRIWVVFTKGDLAKDIDKWPLEETIEQVRQFLPSIEKHFVVSSKTGDNLHLLTGAICDEAKSGYHLYPNGDISNKNERFFATEYIRQQAFELLRDEIPHEVAVVVEEYQDFGRGKESTEKVSSHISASILVNRPSQRAIVVGSKGSMIREIGTRSRKKIEAMIGGSVYLNLHVKVSPNWFINNFVLEEIGLPRAKDSNRVWRQK